MTPTFKMTGFNELMARLIELKEDVGKKTVYRAAGAAARVVREAAKRNAAAANLRDSGALINNIALARSKEFTPPIVCYDVGVRHGTKKQRKTNNDPFYWWYWEFGHHNPFTRQFERRPFMIPAIENNKNEALAAMERTVLLAVNRVTAKAKA